MRLQVGLPSFMNARSYLRATSVTLHLRHHRGDKVFLLLLDTGADFEAFEAQHAGVAGLEQLLDALIRVLDERLTQQRDLVERFAQPTLDHLSDDLRTLAFVLGRFA